MSAVRRYHMVWDSNSGQWGMKRDDNGQYVPHADYEKMAASNQSNYQAAQDLIAKLFEVQSAKAKYQNAYMELIRFLPAQTVSAFYAKHGIFGAKATVE